MEEQVLDDKKNKPGSSLFTKWWSANSSLFQFVAMLIGIGALFLNIPMPQEEVAMTALLDIHFIWLLITTISILVLAWRLLLFSYDLEDVLKKKTNLFISSTFSLITLTVSVWILGALWRYMATLYEERLLIFMNQLNIVIAIVSYAIFLRVIGFIFSKIGKTNFKFIFFCTIFVFVTTLIPAGWNQLATNELGYSAFLSIFLSYSIVYLTLFGISLIVDYAVTSKGKHSIYSVL